MPDGAAMNKCTREGNALAETLICPATGILMERLGVDADAAFGVL